MHKAEVHIESDSLCILHVVPTPSMNILKEGWLQSTVKFAHAKVIPAYTPDSKGSTSDSSLEIGTPYWPERCPPFTKRKKQKANSCMGLFLGFFFFAGTAFAAFKGTSKGNPPFVCACFEGTSFLRYSFFMGHEKETHSFWGVQPQKRHTHPDLQGGFSGWCPSFSALLFPTRQEGIVRFYIGIRVCDASTPRPQPEQLTSGSRRVSRQSSSPQWIPQSIPPELLASESRPVSRQSCSPVDPAEYPTRAARSGSPVDPAEHPAEYPEVARQWIAEYLLPVDLAEYPASIQPERLASIRQWIPPISRQSSLPVWLCLMSHPAHSWVYISCWCLPVLSAP